MQTVLITGANRGIGLALARCCQQQGMRVVGACRRPAAATELADIAELVLPFDAADADAGERLAGQLAARQIRLQLLINNAGGGVDESKGLASLDPVAMQQVYQINTVAPLLLTRALLDLMDPGSIVACLLSRMGVVRSEAAKPGSGYSYPLTKVALLRAIPLLAADLASRQIRVIGLDPGFVATDMTAGAGQDRWKLSAEQSAQGMLRVLVNSTLADSGRALRWDGSPCRWYAPEESAAEQQLLGTEEQSCI